MSKTKTKPKTSESQRRAVHKYQQGKSRFTMLFDIDERKRIEEHAHPLSLSAYIRGLIDRDLKRTGQNGACSASNDHTSDEANTV